jgi:hypothetical protein
MEVIKLALLFSTSLLALYSSWTVALESKCLSERHSLILKNITKAILYNEQKSLYKCGKLKTIKTTDNFIEINDILRLYK